jgi:CheY-like chemotaxis protein
LREESPARGVRNCGGNMAKTLLLADDSVTIQKVVGISFASEDIDLITVDNGDDAVARAKEVRPDAILADVVMPGLNGYEVCEAIKADPNLAHIPVLLLTGTFEAFDDERAQRCGAVGHVAKPFEAQVLVERVHELLAQSAAPSPPAAAAPAAEPVAAAVPQPPAPPAASPDPASVSDSFDFFDDDLGGLAPAENAPPAAAPAAAEDVALAGSDGSFAFGAEDLDAPPPEPVAPGAAATPDRTVAIMPDDPSKADAGAATSLDDSLDFGAPGSDDDLLTADLGGPAPAPTASGDAFDFELDEPGDQGLHPADTELVSASDLAAATVLDPKGASGFDVSYSDLGDPLAEAPAAEPTAPRAEPPPSPAPGPMPAAPAPEPTPRPAAAVPPMAPPPMPEPPAAPPAMTAPAARQPAIPTPAAAPAPDPVALPPSMASTDPMEAAAAAGSAAPAGAPAVPEAPPEPPARPAALQPPEAPRPTPPAPEPAHEPQRPYSAAGASPRRPPSESDSPSGTHDPSALAGMALAEITPRLREELHDTLEKIAWESFGALTEQLVRQVLERAERVAWEVIPEMAETLIREEIRRMKGDSEE